MYTCIYTGLKGVQSIWPGTKLARPNKYNLTIQCLPVWPCTVTMQIVSTSVAKWPVYYHDQGAGLIHPHFCTAGRTYLFHKLTWGIVSIFSKYLIQIGYKNFNTFQKSAFCWIPHAGSIYVLLKHLFQKWIKLTRVENLTNLFSFLQLNSILSFHKSNNTVWYYET